MGAVQTMDDFTKYPVIMRSYLTNEIVCSTYDEFMGLYSQHRLLKLIGD